MLAWLQIQASSLIHNEVIGGRKWPELLREKIVTAVLLDLAGALPCPQIFITQKIITTNNKIVKSEKCLAWEYLHEELLEKIRRLEEDRHAVDVTWSEWGGARSGGRPRARRKAVTVNGPYIVYMLDEQDIMEDWTLIRKALKRTVT